MGDIREYLIGVVASAVLCGVITTLIGKKGMVGSVVKLLTGLLMTMAVVRPWVGISLDGLFGWTEDYTQQGQGIVSWGENIAMDAYQEGIKERTEAYILEKARSMGANLTVEVTLSDGEMPIPIRVTLSGNISPYAKGVLGTMLSQELGIDREEQIWTG